MIARDLLRGRWRGGQRTQISSYMLGSESSVGGIRPIVDYVDFKFVMRGDDGLEKLACLWPSHHSVDMLVP